MTYNKHVIRKALVGFHLLCFLFAARIAEAQQVPLLNQYVYDPSLTFPASAALGESPQLAVLYRQQLTGVEGAPNNLALSYRNPLGKHFGYAINLVNMSVGLLNETRFQASLAYQLKVAKQHKVTFGLTLASGFFSLNDEAANPETLADPVIQNLLGSNGSTWSAGFGLGYSFKEFSLDLSFPDAFKASLSNGDYVALSDSNRPDILLALGYRIPINIRKQIFIKPIAGLRYQEVLGTEFDLLGELEVGPRLSITGGYRGAYGSSLGASFQVTSNIRLSYNQDLGNSEAPFIARGASEIGLHFKFRSKLDKAEEIKQIGEALLSQIREKGIYHIDLIAPEDREKVVDYLYELESSGSKRSRRAKAESRFTEMLEEIKQEEIRKYQAQATTPGKEKQETVNGEAAPGSPEENPVQKAEPKETKAVAVAQTTENNLTNSNNAQAKTSTNAKEKETAEPDLTGPVLNDRTADVYTEPSTLVNRYLVVVAANQNPYWAELNIEKLRKTYPEASMVKVASRGYYYVFVASFEAYQPALRQLEEVRKLNQFSEAWLYRLRR